MKIRLGYACISNALNITSSSTMTYSYYKSKDKDFINDKLDKIIISNFEALKEILNYNIKNEIYFFRMTSNLIPLATHPLVDYEIFKRHDNYFKEIGNIIKNNNLRVDMHPDQFCVLNSINFDTVKTTISILEFYQNMFDAMKIKSKLVLHVGGKTNGKKEGIKRFADKVYICYDGDSAGQNATLRGLDILKENGLDVMVVQLPDKYDPDDVIKTFGKEGYQKLLDESLPLVEFKLKYIKQKYDIMNVQYKRYGGFTYG